MNDKTTKEEQDKLDATAAFEEEAAQAKAAEDAKLDDKLKAAADELDDKLKAAADEPATPAVTLPSEVKAALEAEYPVLGTHGTHDAAMKGLQTDASGTYTPPGVAESK